MNCTGEVIVPGVCRVCLHMLDDHNADNSCETCRGIVREVERRWAAGEGNPPLGWTPAA